MFLPCNGKFYSLARLGQFSQFAEECGPVPLNDESVVTVILFSIGWDKLWETKLVAGDI